jgi:hypothetical protein
MRIRTILAAAAAPLAIGGVLLASAGAASASTGPVPGTTTPNGNSTITQMNGKNGIDYADAVFGPVHVDEVHHAAKNGQPDFDSVTVRSTTGLPLTNVGPGQVGDVGWNSDFHYSLGAPFDVNTGNLHYTVSLDGMSYTGIATYPAG